MPYASFPSSLPYYLPHILQYFGLPMRWRYLSKYPVSSLSTALRSSFGKTRLAQCFGFILIWPISIHDNMTLATSNQPCLLVFRAGGSKIAGSLLGVALGIGL